MKAGSLLLAGVLAAFAVFWPVMGLHYWSDDIDHLHEVGGLRVGRLSLPRFLFLPHNEHIVPVLRVQALYLTSNWGFNAEPAYRLGIFWYGLCAGLAGLLARKLTGSYARGLTAVLLFAAAGTMASMAVTMLTAMMFTQSLACYLLAMLVEKQWAKAACCAAGCVCFPGSFAFAIAVSLESWPRFGWRAGAAWAAISAAAVGLSLSAHQAADSPARAVSLARAPVGLWIPLTAPFRLIWSLTGKAVPGLAMIAGFSATLWAAAVGLGRRMGENAPRRAVLSLLAGAVLQALLTGAGRGSGFSLSEFFMTDRYYTFFLAPAALLIALAAPKHWAMAAAAAVLLIPARLEINRICREVLPYTSPAPLDRARQLAFMIEDELRRDPDVPLVLYDEFVRMPSVHKGGMNLSTVVFVSYPDGLPGLRFSQQLTPQERKRLEDLLFRWRIAHGQ